jgi:hypothetical protein
MDDNVIVEVTVRHLNPTLLEVTDEQYRLLDRDRGRLQDLRWYADAATGEQVRVEVHNVTALRRVEVPGGRRPDGPGR